jgi:hypothetical protein
LISSFSPSLILPFPPSLPAWPANVMTMSCCSSSLASSFNRFSSLLSFLYC